MSRIRLLVVDDHQLLRTGIRRMLEEVADFAVVGEAANGSAAIALAQELQPDVMFVDIAMPGMNGLEVLQQLHETQPQIRVVMLTMHNDEEHVLRSLQLGASGYLLKDAAPGDLELAARAAMRGETWMPPSVSQHVVAGYLARVGDGASATPPNPLTPRQQEVLKGVAEGLSTKEIAAALQISIKTVETHRTQIMEKLALHDIAGLVRYAIRQGIISL